MCKDSKVKDWTFAQTLRTEEMQDSYGTWKNVRPCTEKQLGKEYDNLGFCVMQRALSVDKLTTNLPRLKLH